MWNCCKEIAYGCTKCGRAYIETVYEDESATCLECGEGHINDENILFMKPETQRKFNEADFERWEKQFEIDLKEWKKKLRKYGCSKCDTVTIGTIEIVEKNCPKCKCDVLWTELNEDGYVINNKWKAHYRVRLQHKIRKLKEDLENGKI